MLKWNNFLLIFLVFFAFSCGKFRKIQKSNDWEMKYKAALAYYEKEDYHKAGILFEEVLPFVKVREEGELAQYYYAYCYYYQKQYLLSAHYFRTFFEVYSRSERAEECMYMHAYSLSKESPVYSLDQTSTQEAIVAMQTFLNAFPNSTYKAEATDVMIALRNILEKKAFENARIYYKIRRYRAAVVSFENYENDFPDSDFNEEVGYLKILSQFEWAKLSISASQKERIDGTIEFYLQFIDKYPNSKFIKAVENIYEDCLERIEKLNAE